MSEPVRRHSRKRDALMRALSGTTAHPSAEQLHAALRADYPELSLGTVYRNLAQLRGEGQVIVAAVVNGQERFDADTLPHTHFVCARCGAVSDLCGVLLDEGLSARVASEYGCRVASAELVLRGVCADCLAREASAR